MTTVTIYTWSYADGKVGYSLRPVEGNDAFSSLFVYGPAKDGGSAKYLLPKGYEVRLVEHSPYFYHEEHPGDIATTADGKPGIRTEDGVIPLELAPKQEVVRQAVTIHTWLHESGEVGFSLWAAPEDSTWELDPAKDGGSAEYLVPEDFEVRYNNLGEPTLWSAKFNKAFELVAKDGKPHLHIGFENHIPHIPREYFEHIPLELAE